MAPRLLASRHRRGSRMYWKVRRRRAEISSLRHLKRERRLLAKDLSDWQMLGARQSALVEAADGRGEPWESQAQAQGVAVDTVSVALHEQCAAYIAQHGVRRGQPPWMRSVALPEPVTSWAAYAQAAQQPKDVLLRAVASDSLSFPLTAAYACHLAGVRADPRTGRLSLLILGPEASEIAGIVKWAELLKRSHGLGASSLSLLFVGPRVPKRLDGQSHAYRTDAADSDAASDADAADAADASSASRSAASRSASTASLHVAYLRGLWHECQGRALPKAFRTHASPPDLAIAFNSGLADYAAGWLPTLEALYFGQGVPLAFTSYHQPEAELDARTLAVRLLRCRERQKMKCMPNPFASQLPHLDYLFPGRTYVANAFLSVVRV